MSLLTLRKTPSYISSRYSRFFLTLSRFVSIFFILCLISFKILDRALLTLMMIFKLAEKFRLVRKWMPSQIGHWTGLASGTKNLQKMIDWLQFYLTSNKYIYNNHVCLCISSLLFAHCLRVLDMVLQLSKG